MKISLRLSPTVQLLKEKHAKGELETCVCEDQQTFTNCGYKGILARVTPEDLSVPWADKRYRVERCDACQTYSSDASARQALKRFLTKEKELARKFLGGKHLDKAPLYINHPRLKRFAVEALKKG